MLHMILQFLDEVWTCHTLVFILQYDALLSRTGIDMILMSGQRFIKWK
jgi:hypothetical protein